MFRSHTKEATGVLSATVLVARLPKQQNFALVRIHMYEKISTILLEVFQMCLSTKFSTQIFLLKIVQVRQEAGNPHDRNAAALLKADGTVVGHVPSSFLLGSLGQQSLLTLLGP